MSQIIESSDETFEADIDKVIVIVDFYADWCAPCQQLSPILDEIAAEWPTLTVVKLNIDKHSRTAFRQGVSSLPTLLIQINPAAGGVATTTLRGFQDKATITDTLDSLLHALGYARPR